MNTQVDMVPAGLYEDRVPVELVSSLKKLTEAKLPSYATPGSAAVDLSAAECFTIGPNGTRKVGTGISIGMPPGVCALVLPRSSWGSKGLVLANTVGLIDSDYRGEIFLAMYNRTDKALSIKEGDRIAQMIFVPYYMAVLSVVDKFSDVTERGAGGFGSTGA